MRSSTSSKLVAAMLLTLLTGVGALMPSHAEGNDFLMVSVAPEPAPTATGKTVQARVVIDAPPAMVWQTITNYGELKNVLPGYEKSNVVRSSGANKQVDIAMKVAPFLPPYKYLVQVHENEPALQLTLNRISGDFKALHATYKLIPQSNGMRTLLTYSLAVDTGANLPGSQGLIKSSTEKSLRALERHVEQEARKSFTAQRD